jgi:hypothetical protein
MFEKMQNFFTFGRIFSKICRQPVLGPGNSDKQRNKDASWATQFCFLTVMQALVLRENDLPLILPYVHFSFAQQFTRATAAAARRPPARQTA